MANDVGLPPIEIKGDAGPLLAELAKVESKLLKIQEIAGSLKIEPPAMAKVRQEMQRVPGLGQPGGMNGKALERSLYGPAGEALRQVRQEAPKLAPPMPTPKPAGNLRAVELRAGALALRGKLERCRPAIAAYTGKGIYRALSGRPAVSYGGQSEPVVPGVADFVLPSPSGRSGLPYAEKLRWYRNLAARAAAVGG